jgi:hypothetical protein
MIERDCAGHVRHCRFCARKRTGGRKYLRGRGLRALPSRDGGGFGRGNKPRIRSACHREPQMFGLISCAVGFCGVGRIVVSGIAPFPAPRISGKFARK